MRRILGIPLILFAVAATGCATSTEPDGDANVSLRIVNQTGAAITVVVAPDPGAADFEGPPVTATYGQLANGAQSNHLAVNTRFQVSINAAPISEFYGGSMLPTGIGSQPSDRWTLTLFPTHWDLAADLD